CDWFRRGLRIAPPLGYFHRRWFAGKSDADVVHHAGHLPLFRPHAFVVERSPIEVEESLMKITKTAFLCAVCITLAACEVGPDYERPPVETPDNYKEGVNWQPAQPHDDIDRGAWWSIYKDPILDDFEKQIDVSNQNLKAAEASYRQAVALVEES